MRTLGQSLLVAVLLAVGMGTLAAQTDVEALRAKAEQGDAAAQYYLGLMYGLGRGVPQDDAEAVKWFRMAAEQGYAEAVKWYRMAAKQGDAGAQYYLGLMYSLGQGVPQDYLQAHMWVNLATYSPPAEVPNFT